MNLTKEENRRQDITRFFFGQDTSKFQSQLRKVVKKARKKGFTWHEIGWEMTQLIYDELSDLEMTEEYIW